MGIANSRQPRSAALHRTVSDCTANGFGEATVAPYIPNTNHPEARVRLVAAGRASTRPTYGGRSHQLLGDKAPIDRHRDPCHK